MQPRYSSDRDRIERNVIITADGCWEWQAARKATGYGLMRVRRKTRLVHRFSYETFVGPIPEGLTIDHLCGNRACCNPAHMEPVTQRTNSLRSPLTLNGRNAAKTHCPQNHPYDEDNTYVVPSSGGRACRTCIRDRRTNAAFRAAGIEVAA